MDEKKAALIEKLETESAELMQQIRQEDNLDKKKKLIAHRENVQRKLTAARNNRKISRETKRNLIAYSFIAPNFLGVRHIYPDPYYICLHSRIYELGRKQ